MRSVMTGNTNFNIMVLNADSASRDTTDQPTPLRSIRIATPGDREAGGARERHAQPLKRVAVTPLSCLPLQTVGWYPKDNRSKVIV